jgi:hypothetical protein
MMVWFIGMAAIMYLPFPGGKQNPHFFPGHAGRRGFRRDLITDHRQANLNRYDYNKKPTHNIYDQAHFCHLYLTPFS